MFILFLFPKELIISQMKNKDQPIKDFVQSEKVHTEKNSSQNNEKEPMEYEDVNEIINIESNEVENRK